MAEQFEPSNDPLLASSGKNGLDISTLTNYDENTSLDDIKGAYNQVGNRYGDIAQSAAKNVSARQTKLIGNDFGGVNSQLYSNYYQPGETNFKSMMNVEGTQKALEVGMERGKAAAEANFKAAQNEYNNAQSAYENFRNSVENGKYEVGTFDESLLPEGMTLEEFQSLNEIEGMSKTDYINRRLETLQNAQGDKGVDWDVYEDADAANQVVLNKYGKTWDEIQGMSEEDRAAFWRDGNVSIDWRNAYYENQLKRTLGDKAVDQYREAVAANIDYFSKIYDGYNQGEEILNDLGFYDNVCVAPMALPSFEAQESFKNENFKGESKYDNLDDYDSMSVEQRSNLMSADWLKRNLDEETFKKAMEYAKDNVSLMSGSRVKDYINGLYSIVKGKLTNQGGEKGLNALAQFAYSDVADILGFSVDDLKSYIAIKRTNPQLLDTLKHSYAMARGYTSMMEVADGEKWYLINGKYKQPEAGTVIMMSMPGTTNDDGSFNSKEFEAGLKALQDLQNPTANHTDDQRAALEKTINENFAAYYQQCAYQAAIQAIKPSRRDFRNMFLESLVLYDIEKYKDLEFVNDKGEKVTAAQFLKDFNNLANTAGGEAYKLYSDAMFQTYQENGYIYIGSDNGSIYSINIMNGDKKHTNVFSYDNDKKGSGDETYQKYGHGLSADTIYNLISAGINIYNKKGKADKQPDQDTSFYVDPVFIREGVSNENGGLGMLFNNIAGKASQGVGVVWNFFASLGAMLATGFENTANAITGRAEENKNPFTDVKIVDWDTLTGAVNNAANDLGNDPEEYSGRSIAELFTDEDRVEDSYAQWFELNDHQQDIVARAINAVTMYTWFGDSNGNVASQGLGGSSNAHNAVAQNGFAQWLNQSGFDFLGLSNMFAGDYQFWKGVGGFIGTMVGFKAMSIATRNVVGTVKNAAVRASTNINLALSDSILKQATSLQTTLASTITAAEDATMAGAEMAGIGAANTAINTAIIGGKITEKAIREAKIAYSKTAAGIANGTIKKEVIEKFSKSFVDTVKQSKYYSGLVEQLGEKGTEEFLRNMSTNAGAVMKEVVSNSAIGNLTGLSALEVSQMTARDQRLINKVIEGFGEEAVPSLNKNTWFAEKFLKSLTKEEITDVTKAIIEGTKESAKLGLKWTAEDTARILQSKGWMNASKSVFMKEFAKDMVGDVFRDNIRNLTNPYYTEEGYKRQTVEEYFTNPNTWIQNFLSSTWQFAKQRLNAEVMTSVSLYKRNKALNAISSTGDASDAGSIKAMQKAQYWSAQAQKWSNAAFKSGSNYTRIKKQFDSSNAFTAKAQTEMLTQMGVDADYIEVETGGTKYRFENTDEFKKWAEENKVNSFDALNVGLKTAVIDAEGRYVVNSVELGGDQIRGLGALNAADMLIDMHKIEIDVREKNIDSVIADSNLTIYEKSQKLYGMMVDAIDAKYGKSNAVVGLRKSLTMYYQNFLDELNTRVEALKKKGLSEQEILDAKLVRLGYTPIASWYNQTPFEDKVLRGLSFGSQTIDKLATDTTAGRKVYDRELLDAFARGDSKYELKDADGNVVREYILDPRGLNFLDSLTVYQNSNLAKKILTPIFGDEEHGKFDFAASALRMRYAYVESTDTANKVATFERDDAARQIAELTDYVTKTYLDAEQGATEASKQAYAKAEADALEESEAILKRNIQNKERLLEYAQTVRENRAEAKKIESVTSGDLPEEFQSLPAIVLGMYDFDANGMLDLNSINVDAGKALYDIAVDDTRRIIKYYNDGVLDDSGTMTYTGGKDKVEGQTNMLDDVEVTKKIKLHQGIEIELDEQDMAKIVSAAASGQQFDMDLAMSVMIKSRKAEVEHFYEGLKKFTDKIYEEGVQKFRDEHASESLLTKEGEQPKVKNARYLKTIDIELKPNQALVNKGMEAIKASLGKDSAGDMMVLGTDANGRALELAQGLYSKARMDDEQAGTGESILTSSMRALVNKISMGEIEDNQKRQAFAKKKAEEWSTANDKWTPQRAYQFLYEPSGFSEDVTYDDGTTKNRDITQYQAKDLGFDVLSNGKYSAGSERIYDIVFSAIGENIKKFNKSGELDRTDMKMLSALRTQLDTQIRTEVGEHITIGELTQRLTSMMPDTKIYSIAKETGLIENFTSLDADGISTTQLRGLITDDYITKKTNGSLNEKTEYNYLAAISLLTDMEESAARPRLRVETQKITDSKDQETEDSAVNEAGEAIEGTSGVKPKTEAEAFLAKNGNETTEKVTAFDRNSVIAATQALGEVLKGFKNKKSVYYSSALSTADKARKNVNKFINDMIGDKGKILSSLKKLYTTNEQYKKMVDSWSENRKQSMTKAGVKEVAATPVDNDYLNAIGIVKPGYELTSTGNSKNHKTSEEYYAALNNVPITVDLSEGYSEGAYNKMYLAAGRKGAHIQQLLTAAENMRAMGAKVPDFTKEANKLLDGLDYSQLTLNQLSELKASGPLGMLPSKTEKTWKRMLKANETISYNDINTWQRAKKQIAQAQSSVKNPKKNTLTGERSISDSEVRMYRADMLSAQEQLNAIYGKFTTGAKNYKKIDTMFADAIEELGKKNSDIFALSRSLESTEDSFYNDSIDNVENSFYGVASYVYDPSVEKMLTLSKEEAGRYANAIQKKIKSLGSQPKSQDKSGELKTYSGDITPGENTVFVFGSNPEGRHGAGSAKVAVEQFGAVYGQGEGLQGNSYALPTKDLRVAENGGKRSISPEQITKNIQKMYAAAKQNPEKQFKVAYRTEENLNGYSLKEMADMFMKAGKAPENVYFSEEMAKYMSGTQPTAETAAETLTPIKTGNMDFNYGNGAQPYIKEKTTFDAVKSGNRTSTTRLASEHADYWKDIKAGDIVEFKNKDKTDSVLVRVTKAPTWLDFDKMDDVEFESLLQKEGWTESAYNKIIVDKVKAGDKALQFEYELVDNKLTNTNAPENTELSQLKQQYDYFKDYQQHQYVDQTTGKRSFFTRRQVENSLPSYNNERIIRKNPYESPMVPISTVDQLASSVKNNIDKTVFASADGKGRKTAMRLSMGVNENGTQQINLSVNKKFSEEQVADLMRNAYGVEPEEYDIVDSYAVMVPRGGEKMAKKLYEEKEYYSWLRDVNDIIMRAKKMSEHPDYAANIQQLYDAKNAAVKRIAEAREFGDLSENEEYRSARDELKQITAQIDSLNSSMSTPAAIKNAKGELVKNPDYISTSYDNVLKLMKEGSDKTWVIVFKDNSSLYDNTDDYDTAQAKQIKEGIDAGEGWVTGGEHNMSIAQQHIADEEELARMARPITRIRSGLDELQQKDSSQIAEPNSYYARIMSSMLGDKYNSLHQAEVDYDEAYDAYLRLSEGYTKYKQKILSDADSKGKKVRSAIDQYERYFADANPDNLLLEKLLKENKAQYNKLIKKKASAEDNLQESDEKARTLVGAEVWDRLKKLIKQKQAADKFLNSEDARAAYTSSEGHVFVKDGYRAPGTVTTDDTLTSLGWSDSYVRGEDDGEGYYTKENRRKRKSMQKEINKKLNQNTSGKKDYTPYESIDFSHLDEASRKATMNNILDFKDSMKKLMAEKYGIEGDVNTVMDKNYVDLLQVIVPKERAGVTNRPKPTFGDDAKLKDVTNEAKYLGKEAINKFLTITRAGVSIAKATQDFQMAGGFANINAMTIVQLRQNMYQQFSLNPLKAGGAIKDFLNVAYNTRNSAAAYDMATELLPFLQKNANYFGDTNPLTDLNGVLSRTPGYDDGGTVNSLISNWLKHVDELSESQKGFGGKLKQLFVQNPAEDFKVLFSDATFKNTLPLFRAWMLKQNYDEALRYLKRTGQASKMSQDDLDYACHAAAYGKTLEFFEPAKTRGKTLDQIIQNTGVAADRRRLASFTGMKRGASYLDVAGDVFFALRYKMTLGGQVVSGLKEALSPSAIMRRGRVLLGNGQIETDADGNPMPGKNDYMDTFIHSGSLRGIGALATIAVICHFWSRAMGVPSAWDSTQYVDEKGNLQIPEILKKVQTIGQFWLPNAYDKEKGFYMDPTRKQVGIDNMSSTFTLSNSVFKTIDKSINPKAYNKNQRGVGLFGQELGINPQGLNNILNNDIAAAIGDELIASNMLSPWKAMYEILTDNTYFGNNIWEKKYLPDGSENKNYDPFRNMTASFFHLLNLDWFLTGGTNAWVKGKYSDYENRVLNPDYVAQDNIGTVAGSGVFQHEFVSAAISIMNGDALGGIVEAGEIPIKTRNLSTQARTEFNTKVKNTLMQLAEDYKAKVKNVDNPDTKDAYYRKFVKEAADTVASWSAKWDYVLGEKQELVAYATRALMAICAGEYDDNLNYVQNAYWKASSIAQIEQGTALFLTDEDLEKWIAEGKSEEEFAKEREKRSAAWNKALVDEYEAMKALEAAGVDTSFITRDAVDYFDAMKSTINKKVYEGIHETLEKPIGEFKNFKEMKTYYEEQIDAATSTKTKVKLAEKYNSYLTDALAPYVEEYGAAIFKDGYYNKEGLANSIADYVIIPADKYYRGKTPRASYLKDLFHVGYTDRSALPSDDEYIERFVGALRTANAGNSASAARLLDGIIKDVKAGRLYVTDKDYSRIVNMKALLSARSK